MIFFLKLDDVDRQHLTGLVNTIVFLHTHRSIAMPITQNEAEQIANQIAPIFNPVLNAYDFEKYPFESYQAFRDAFTNLNPTNDDIANALIWKWGHWGKLNFPQAHRNLIQEIQGLFPIYRLEIGDHTPQNTFNWWSQHLNRASTFITVAFITHLIHHEAFIPIIDQHNFRGMNALLRTLRPLMLIKKKPSNWEDIINLKNFMNSIHKHFTESTYSEIDRFLMMYGKQYVKRV